MIPTSLDTSIVTLIKHSTIVQNKKTGNVYLINSWSCRMIAQFTDNSWVASTGEFQLNISLEDIDNLTDMDKVSDWTVIA